MPVSYSPYRCQRSKCGVITTFYYRKHIDWWVINELKQPNNKGWTALDLLFSFSVLCFNYRSNHWLHTWWYLIIREYIPCTIWSAWCHILLSVRSETNWKQAAGTVKELQWKLVINLVCHSFCIFRASETTQACKNGRSTSIRLRCDPTVTAMDQISLPRYAAEFWNKSSENQQTNCHEHRNLRKCNPVLLNCGVIVADSAKLLVHSNTFWWKIGSVILLVLSST